MKNILNIVVTLWSIAAQAQIEHPKFMAHNHKYIAEGIIRQQAKSHKAGKQTNSGQRLVNAGIRRQGLLIDSVSFSWSGNRETVHTYNPEDLTFSSWRVSPLAVHKFEIPQYLRYPEQKYDSATRYFGGGINNTPDGIANIFDVNNCLTKFDYYKNDRAAPYYFQMAYNTAGEMKEAKCFIDTSMIPTGNYIHFATLVCTYDNAGKLLKDEVTDTARGFYQWYDYLRDASGKDTAIWINSYYLTGDTTTVKTRLVLDYYGNGFLRSIKSFDEDNILTSVDSFGYSGIYPYPVFNQAYQLNNSRLNVTHINEKIMTLNVNGDVQTYLERYYTSSTNRWDSTYRYVATYNSFNNPDVLYIDTYTGNGWINNNQEIHYHYQTLTDLSEKINETTLNFFPNPTTSTVTVLTHDEKNAIVHILDMGGRTLQRQTVSGRSTIIDLKNLPVGTYLIRLETATTVSSAKIQKQ